MADQAPVGTTTAEAIAAEQVAQRPQVNLPQQPKWTRMPIRTRPHRNPLAENDDGHPDSPIDIVQKLPDMYPVRKEGKKIEFVDVGCAFGGMLFALAPMFPDTLMLGLEIRPKVVQFAQEKAVELRQNAQEGVHHNYQNIWFDQVNVMKYGSNYFEPGQLTKLFFTYPDPHWKRKNIRRRIIGPGLVHEYAFWMKEGGILYTCTDVPELETWMIDCLDACPLFERIPQEELLASEFDRKLMEIVTSSSEDAQRTQRKGLTKNFAAHRRVKPPQSTRSMEVFKPAKPMPPAAFH